MSNTVRLLKDILQLSFDDEGDVTRTSVDQEDTEKYILKIYDTLSKKIENEGLDENVIVLSRKDHMEYLNRMLSAAPQGYECLDASRPWLVYWILHSLWLLNALPEQKVLSKVVDFLAHCQHPNGGFGGGPGQDPHLATTYAAVNALTIIGTEEAFKIINRKGLVRFLMSIKDEDGSFAVHKGGEQDIRGVYCALSITKLTDTYSEALFEGTPEWVFSCQTYEGGFGACPGMEAHGGYTFCGIAALVLLNKPHLLDTDAALRWCANRQMKLEGGFQGRTNKLVDGCYSFWQGGSFPILQVLLRKENSFAGDLCLLDERALQEYVLLCCQCNNGGLRDKPGKIRDAYHTCYTLSGLSVAQHGIGLGGSVVGDRDNEVGLTHPVHNVAPHAVNNIVRYFKEHPTAAV